MSLYIGVYRNVLLYRLIYFAYTFIELPANVLYPEVYYGDIK